MQFVHLLHQQQQQQQLQQQQQQQQLLQLQLQQQQQIKRFYCQTIWTSSRVFAKFGISARIRIPALDFFLLVIVFQDLMKKNFGEDSGFFQAQFFAAN